MIIKNLSAEIPNFHQVNDWFYRGGQPSKEAYALLAEAGFGAVICLRSNGKAVGQAQSFAQKAGLKFFSIPMSYLPGPTYKDIRRFFSIIKDEHDKPLLLYCWQGCDRTGVLVALYRICKDHWSVDEAYEEMKASGFHSFYVHHFKWILYGYAWMLRNRLIDDSMA
jgi:protein tyrosine phosphatase (PTP) superfamily phosphohydrolase (DUF442 family)